MSFCDETLKNLFKTLDNGEEEKFVRDLFKTLDNGEEKKRDETRSQYVNVEFNGETLLQCASRNNLPEAVKILLLEGAEVTSTQGHLSPIETAAKEGFFKVFDVFLNNCDLKIPNNLLNYLCVNQATTEEVNHYKCLDLWLEKRNDININVEIDSDKNTLLHHTAKFRTPEKTLNLLRRGASMAFTNNRGEFPIEYIDASTLETHLDECLEVNLECDIHEKDFTATFNYETIMPLMGTSRGLNLVDVERPLTDKAALTAEMAVISCMINLYELEQLLKHPVIASFLYIKWHKVQWFSLINLLVFVVFSQILVMTSVFNARELGALRVCLFVIMIIIFVRGFVVLRRSGARYFTSPGNWVPIVTVVLAFIVIIAPVTELSQKYIKQIEPFFILAVTFEIMRLLGQFPNISTYGVMMHTVSYTFFKVLLWYFIFILAFSLNFHILHLFTDAADYTLEVANSNEVPIFFANFPLALFKTMVMLTGELDIDSVNFAVFPVTSHIMFLLFVFIVPIILLNLLTGLAVSDMQMIKTNAEALGQGETVKLIASVEFFLLCLPEYSFLMRYISRFFLLRQKVTVYPNRKSKIQSGFRFGLNIDLGEKITARVMQVIEKRKEKIQIERNLQDSRNKQEQHEKRIEELHEKIDFIINNMCLKPPL